MVPVVMATFRQLLLIIASNIPASISRTKINQWGIEYRQCCCWLRDLHREQKCVCVGVGGGGEGSIIKDAGLQVLQVLQENEKEI